MRTKQDDLINLEKEIKTIMECCEAHIKNAPNGNLRICKKKNRKTPEIYLKTGQKGENANGKYLHKEDEEIARRIAQRDYCQTILKEAEKVYKVVKKINDANSLTRISEAFQNLHDNRKKLVTPIIVPDEEYVEKWLRTEYQMMGFEGNDSELYTEKGERVRSKSEKILADKFFAMGVPYLYEKPLKLEGYGEIHPDFCVLNVRKRKSFYWEHFGMMDDLEYMEKALKKLDTYAKNGYLVGKNLLCTFETRQRPINMQAVNDMIHAFLL